MCENEGVRVRAVFECERWLERLRLRVREWAWDPVPVRLFVGVSPDVIERESRAVIVMTWDFDGDIVTHRCSGLTELNRENLIRGVTVGPRFVSNIRT